MIQELAGFAVQAGAVRSLTPTFASSWDASQKYDGQIKLPSEEDTINVDTDEIIETTMIANAPHPFSSVIRVVAVSQIKRLKPNMILGIWYSFQGWFGEKPYNKWLRLLSNVDHKNLCKRACR